MSVKRRKTPLKQQVRVHLAARKKQMEKLQAEITKLEKIIAAMEGD